MAPSKSKRSSWSLPIDLVEEIPYRVPAGSLVRFKRLCKQWYALLNDKRFIYEQLNLSRVQHFVEADGKSIQLFNLENQALSWLQGPSHISAIIHCDGLLLCSCFERSRISGCVTQTFRNQLAVWNPFLNRVTWIEASDILHPFDVVGFGYENVSRDNYKILRLDHEHKYFEIYEFKSKLWKSVTLDCRGVNIWRAQYQAVSMNGNMYWIAYRKKDNSKFFIQSFDFSTETFKHICWLPFKPDWFAKNNLHTVVLSGFGGDRLSLLHQDKHMKMIEVWVTNKVTDRVVLWSKYFNMSCPNLPILHPFLAYFIHKTNKITLWCESLQERYFYTNVYEMGEGEIKKLVDTGRSQWSGSGRYVNYVPSLVPVPE